VYGVGVPHPLLWKGAVLDFLYFTLKIPTFVTRTKSFATNQSPDSPRDYVDIASSPYILPRSFAAFRSAFQKFHQERK
jgi:hypothetical protein